MNKFYLNQRVKAVVAINSDAKILRGQIGFVKKMPREGIVVVDFCCVPKGNESLLVSVYPDEIEAYPVEPSPSVAAHPINAVPQERRVNVDPVVRDMYDALKKAVSGDAYATTTKQINAAIAQAQKHFKGLQAVTLEEKESVVDETFPGIYRETRACVTIYSPEEWAAMMDVLYVKALHSRAKGEVVSGGIKPIKAKDLKNLG